RHHPAARLAGVRLPATRRALSPPGAGPWSFDAGDRQALPHGLVLTDEEPDGAVDGRHDLRIHLGHLDLGDELPPGDAVTVRDVPGGQHALGVGVGVVDRWEEHLGHASTVLIAASIRSCRGSTAYSRSWA